jgi:cell division protein ZapE
MLLAGLLEALFAEGVVLVATSNIEPQGLYRNGLQRERFLPAIALLNSHTQVVKVSPGSDYRLRSLEQATLYHCPDGSQARQAMQASMVELVANPEHLQSGQRIEVLGRVLQTQLLGDGVVWFEFAELCDGPRSAFDYVELARLYETVLISGVPVFNDSRNDQARRFINLVDELYDRRVKLIIAANAPIVELYQGSQLSFEFERTASRLLEMQSKDYLGAAHKA